MPGPIEARYIGDAVYAVCEEDRVRLTTSSHLLEHADNVIYLEPREAQALLDYLQEWLNG